ncbi:hypothetical protein [Microbacterium atlanticum]|uniref:hypothetical protein n=1 Tax=Microbacterium atlanticum TaxID=2782168 RepID=UPI001887B722|nr:hypothetical protein [Microbacterium atlanticum]
MGTNRRYADHYDRLMGERILQRVAAGGPLETLTRLELRLDDLPCTTDPKPKPVRAWVRFGGTPIQVDAEACMWTPRAIAIRFRISGTEYRCWVWASAVDGTGDTDASPGG